MDAALGGDHDVFPAMSQRLGDHAFAFAFVSVAIRRVEEIDPRIESRL